MQKIIWIERKRNQDVLEIVGEKRSLVDSIRGIKWKMIGHTFRHPEELHNTIIEGMIEGMRSSGQCRNTFIGQIKKVAGTGSYKTLK